MSARRAGFTYQGFGGSVRIVPNEFVDGWVVDGTSIRTTSAAEAVRHYADRYNVCMGQAIAEVARQYQVDPVLIEAACYFEQSGQREFADLGLAVDRLRKEIFAAVVPSLRWACDLIMRAVRRFGR